MYTDWVKINTRTKEKWKKKKKGNTRNVSSSSRFCTGSSLCKQLKIYGVIGCRSMSVVMKMKMKKNKDPFDLGRWSIYGKIHIQVPGGWGAKKPIACIHIATNTYNNVYIRGTLCLCLCMRVLLYIIVICWYARGERQPLFRVHMRKIALASNGLLFWDCFRWENIQRFTYSSICMWTGRYMLGKWAAISHVENSTAKIYSICLNSRMTCAIQFWLFLYS